MKVEPKKSNYHYEWFGEVVPTQPTLVCLHGFTSTSQSFKDIDKYVMGYNILGIDLIGHGQSPSPKDLRPYEMAAVCEQLTTIVTSFGIDSLHVLGYSMGARTALAWSVAQPKLIKSLILESGSPGLATASERKARQTADEKLANRIETEGIVNFVNFWEQLPLFHSQERLSQIKRQQLRAERLSQHPLGLANSLRGMGTGQQQSYWSDLKQMKIPMLCLTGSLDEKFCLIADEMANESPLITWEVIPGLGHCLHLENPALFYKVVDRQLKEVATI